MFLKPFDFFNDISNKKGDLLTKHPELVKDFGGMSYIICRALSFHIDAILVVDNINDLPNMQPESMYNLLCARVRRKHRKWINIKSEKMDDELEIISKHFGYSQEKSISAHKLLSSEFIQSLIVKYDTGGSGRAKRKSLPKKKK